MEERNVTVRILSDDGTFPNNERLPVLVYRDVLQGADEIEKTFHRHGWRGSWRNGIYSYHHYHSTAHEVLGVATGSARVQLGGPQGEQFDLEAGDVVVIPAGVAHKNLASSDDFLVVGAYPQGQDYDMNYGKSGERPKTDENIARTPLPETDPVYGSDGPLTEHWK